MNTKEIEACGDDKSSSVTFNVSIICENGRLNPEQRRRVASIINRAIGTVTLSLGAVVEGRFDIEVEKRSSAHGTVCLDNGKEEE